jgi:hypothetical protein
MSGNWEKVIGLADMHGTVLTASYEPPEDENDEACGWLSLTCGAAIIDCAPTSDALRRSAAALLDLADAVDGQPAEA